MRKVAIVTDSSSGFSQEEAEKLGIKIMYIPFIIDGEEYSEDKNLTRDNFFNLLESSGHSQSLINIASSVSSTFFRPFIFFKTYFLPKNKNSS